MRIASLSSLVAILVVFSAPAWAAEVWVYETSGPGGDRAGNTLLEALRSELPGVDVTLQARPRFLKTASVKLAKKLAKAVSASGADFCVASTVVKKRRKLSLVLVVVSADGAVVFDKVLRLPKRRPEKKVKGAIRNVARAIEDEMRRAKPPPEPEPEPEPETIAATSIGGGGDEDSAPIEPTTIATPTTPMIAPEKEEPTPIVSRRRRRDPDGLHAAVRGGAGGLFFKDDILTTVQGGELNIQVGMTMLTTAGVQLAYDNWLSFTGSFRYYGATIVHSYDGDDPDTPNIDEPVVDPREIGCTAIGTTALLGTGMQMGPLIGGLRLGVTYDSFSAESQRLSNSVLENEVAVLVPSWTRLAMAAGITLGYGPLAAEGVSGELGALFVPWGSHQESPRTSGSSSTILGGQGWLRVRYSMPNLFGSAGGVFADIQADFEFLKIQYKGNGTRSALGGTEPVQASKESRLSIGTALSVGYIF